MKKFDSEERKKERARKHNCAGICYSKHSICPLAKTCNETRVKEFVFGLWENILTMMPIIFIIVYILRVCIFK